MAERIYNTRLTRFWSEVFEVQIPDDFVERVDPFFSKKFGEMLRRRTIMVEWIERNCKDEWCYPDEGKFLFKNELDALAFKLRWL